MWPPQSVNTWPTPAPLSVRATSSPPVLQSEGAAPYEPPRLSSRQPPRFTDSPRPAGIRSQTRLGRRGLDHRLASPAAAARTAAPRRPAARTAAHQNFSHLTDLRSRPLAT